MKTISTTIYNKSIIVLFKKQTFFAQIFFKYYLKHNATLNNLALF